MLKKLLVLSLTTGSIFAFNYSDKVPGKNYTYRDFLLNRALIRKIQKNSNPNQLNGSGMEFYGTVKITTEEIKKDGGGWEKKKKYQVYVRNCGNIDLPEKNEDIMKKVFNGTRVKLTLSGSSCKVSDWMLQ